MSEANRKISPIEAKALVLADILGVDPNEVLENFRAEIAAIDADHVAERHGEAVEARKKANSPW